MSVVYTVIAKFLSTIAQSSTPLSMTKGLTDHLVEAHFQLNRSHVRNL